MYNIYQKVAMTSLGIKKNFATERPEQILKSYPFMLGHKEILLEGDVEY